MSKIINKNGGSATIIMLNKVKQSAIKFVCENYLGDTHTNATHYDMSETERPRHPLLTTM